MKKILLIYFLFAAFILNAQISKVNVTAYKQLTQAQVDGLTVPAGENWVLYNITADELQYWDGTAWQPVGGGSGPVTVAIVAEDEGNGLTYFPNGNDRTYKAAGGAGALDMSFADNTGSLSPNQGSPGQQSLSLGYNIRNAGYGGLMIGEESEISTTGTYAVSQGYGNVVGGYTSVGLGTYLNSTANYSYMYGHTISSTNGGNNLFFGRALSDTTSGSDAAIFMGQGNKEPNASLYHSNNNIIGIFGVGELSGAGSTPFVVTKAQNSMIWYRGALAGAVSLPLATIDSINAWDADGRGKIIPTVEWTKDYVANNGGGGGIGGSIGADQVAYGTAANTIGGEAAFLYDPANNTLFVDQLDAYDVNTEGFINMAPTNDAVSGVIRQGVGNNVFHTYTGSANVGANDWTTNTFIGLKSGNFTSGGTGFQGSLNVGVGAYTLNSLTTGQQNNMIGNEAGALITSGFYNNGMGDGALYNLTTGDDNLAFGKNTLQNITTSDGNIALGRNAGFFINAGTNLTSATNSIFLGRETRASANGNSNEIVIGYNARGKGTNTATIGSADLTHFYIGTDTGLNPAYWSDNHSEEVKVRPYSGGFDVETTQAGAFGGGTDKMRLVSTATSTEERQGGVIFTGDNSESVWLRFVTDSGTGGENGLDFFLGNDYFDFGDARAEHVRPETIIDPSSSNQNVTAINSGQIRVLTSGVSRTLTIPDTLDEEAGANITYINGAAGGTVTIATSGTATINGSSSYTYDLGPMTDGETTSVQLIHLADGSDDWILIGNYVKN